MSGEQVLPVGVISNQYAQDEEVAEVAVDDEAIWLEEPGGRVLVLHRSVRRGVPRGNVILITGPGLGSSGLSHSANLRRSLTLYGWNTYFVRLPEYGASAGSPSDAGEAAAAESDRAGENRVRAAVALVRGRSSEGLVILIAQASGSRGLGEVTDLDVDGLILLNLSVTPVNTTLLKDMTTPTLVLQEQPANWQKKYPLADGVELQQLPRSYPRQEDGRLLRRIRGWLKRRYGSS